MSYRQLDGLERKAIKQGIDDGLSYRDIGLKIGRHHSTISREIKRYANGNRRKYNYYKAKYAAYRIRWSCRQRLRLKSEEIINHVLKKLKLGWAPEIIAGRWRKMAPENYVCHETIYQFIYIEAPEWIQYLPRRHRVRKFLGYSKRHRSPKIKGKTSISKRPISANERLYFGHWEADSAVSRGSKVVIHALLERVSRLVKLTHLQRNTAMKVESAIVRKLKTLPTKVVKSITYDNGSENSRHLVVNKKLDCKSYFCHPYHWEEKGAVEEIFSLVRRFFPKGTDFAKISRNSLKKVENLLNNRPRKCLDYQTPIEVFEKRCGALQN
jgi:IS30 family transposase